MCAQYTQITALCKSSRRLSSGTASSFVVAMIPRIACGPPSSVVATPIANSFSATSIDGMGRRR